MLLLTLADFLQQNYLWLIIVAVILVLALIGYIAEKHNIVAFKREPKVIPSEPKITEPVVKEEPKIYEQVINVDGKQVPVDEIEKIDFNGDLIKPTIEEITIPKPVPDVVPALDDIYVPSPDDLPTAQTEKKKPSPDIDKAEVIAKEIYQPEDDELQETEENPSDSEIWKF